MVRSRPSQRRAPSSKRLSAKRVPEGGYEHGNRAIVEDVSGFLAGGGGGREGDGARARARARAASTRRAAAAFLLL
jgi:hypothetical protein